MQLKKLSPFFWLAGDVLALIAFVYIGQRDHDLVDETNPAWGVLKQVLYFAGPWLAVGVWLRAFHFGELGARDFFSRSFNAWLVATLLGILVRSLFMGRAVIPTNFLAATLFFGGLFVLGWRVVVLLAALARQRQLVRQPQSR